MRTESEVIRMEHVILTSARESRISTDPAIRDSRSLNHRPIDLDGAHRPLRVVRCDNIILTNILTNRPPVNIQPGHVEYREICPPRANPTPTGSIDRGGSPQT